MNAIHFVTLFETLHVVYVEPSKTMDFMSFLEGCESVDRYKIISGECGTLTESNLRYSYPGYVKPAGKLVEKLYHNE